MLKSDDEQIQMLVDLMQGSTLLETVKSITSYFKFNIFRIRAFPASGRSRRFTKLDTFCKWLENQHADISLSVDTLHKDLRFYTTGWHAIVLCT